MLKILVKTTFIKYKLLFTDKNRTNDNNLSKNSQKVISCDPN